MEEKLNKTRFADVENIVNLRQISNKMVSTSPVFIVGGARSGSSILYKSLQKHSSFMPKVLNYSETNIFTISSRTNYVESQPMLGRIFRYYMEDQKILMQFMDSTRAIRNWQWIINTKGLVNGIISKSAGLKKFWGAINFNHYFFRSFFFFAQKARTCQRIVEKSPSHINCINEIIDAFPTSKILYIYRHPVDTYSSYRRRLKVETELGMEPKKLEWLMLSVDDFCKRYRREMNTILGLANIDRERVYLIRYEDFTQKPETEFRNICSFLGENYESAALVEEKPDLSKWAPDPNLFGQIIPETKQWENHLSSADARKIEQDLEETLRILDYASYTKS